MARQKTIYRKIEKLRERYFKNIHKKESLIKILTEAEISEQVYNSNAIENSTLSLEETEKILLQIDLDRYISEREIFEAKNLSRVVEYINNKAKEKDLDIEMILFLHKMLISNIRDDIAGRFRKKQEFVRVGNHIAPAPQEVLERMYNLLNEYNSNVNKNIIERIAKVHLAFEYTHPFVDGNGRIGRVINNYLLIRDGYVPINIKFIDRAKYYDALKEFDKNGITKIMEDIVANALAQSYYKRLTYMEGKEIVTLNEYSKRQKVSLNILHNKAKRGTIEAFLEKGVWKIGI